MRLAFVDDFVPALVVGDEVVDITPVIAPAAGAAPQAVMSALIAHFEELRPALERAARGGGRPLRGVRLHPPLPAPPKILCTMGGYMEGVANGVRKGIDMFLKAPSAVIGPQDTIVLPDAPCPIFHHEAELGVVIGRTIRNASEADAARAVFGYLNFIDVSGRGFPLEPSIVSVPSWLGKSFDTFAPLGPWITTADEVPDVGQVQVRLWVNGQLQQDYSTTDAEYPVARLVAFASSVMTLGPGDVIACGTNHQGLGPIQDGDHVTMQIDGLGCLEVAVRDPLQRTWPRGTDRAFAERVRSRRIPARS